MHYLGLSNNTMSGVASITDGYIDFAASEERFKRIKNYIGFPNDSLNYLQMQTCINISEYDVIAYGFSNGFDSNDLLGKYLSRLSSTLDKDPKQATILMERWKREHYNDKKTRIEFINWAKSLDITSRVFWIDHHSTHAYGAFLFSPFNKALVVTMDGRGDFLSASARLIDSNGNVEILSKIPTFDSLGYFYGRICEVLGFKANRHEGKVTGLAAFGAKTQLFDLFKTCFTQTQEGFIAEIGQIYSPFYCDYLERLREVCINYKREDIAFAAQTLLEEIIIQYIKNLLERNEVNDVCLAGGVFANVRINQKIAELSGVDNLYVLPFMGDEGLPLQVAAAAAFILHKTRPYLNTLYLGTKSHYQAQLPLPDGLTQKVVDIDFLVDFLRKGSVLGTCLGQSEFGARALGNRSLLINPAIPKISSVVSRRLKREVFMPLAPIIRQDRAGELLQGYNLNDPSQHYMARAYRASLKLQTLAPEACHIDGTVRAQILKVEQNPWLYDLLLKFENRSGVPCLINTSFNMHEEPIVNTYQDALNGLIAGICDGVITENMNFVFPERSK